MLTLVWQAFFTGNCCFVWFVYPVRCQLRQFAYLASSVHCFRTKCYHQPFDIITHAGNDKNKYICRRAIGLTTLTWEWIELFTWSNVLGFTLLARTYSERCGFESPDLSVTNVILTSSMTSHAFCIIPWPWALSNVKAIAHWNRLFNYFVDAFPILAPNVNEYSANNLCISLWHLNYPSSRTIIYRILSGQILFFCLLVPFKPSLAYSVTTRIVK